jgi:hypothetical protein
MPGVYLENSAATLQSVLDCVQWRSFHSMVTKLTNKLVGDRDHFAREVMYHLLRLQLCHSSRTFLFVDLRSRAEHSDLCSTSVVSEFCQRMTLLERCKDYDESDDLVTYLAFLLRHKHSALYSDQARACD